MAYVIKGTPPGYDVTSAIDYLQSFNSSWPLLKIHDTDTSSATVDHGLGYPPFHLVTYPSGGFAPGAIDQNAHNEWSVSSSQLVRASGSGSPRHFIFRLDLTTNFEAPTISGSTTQGAQADGYVFKMTKTGADISSTDMRDFSLHSNTRSPMIHKVDHGAMSAGGGLGLQRIVTHNLGYVPLVFAFIRPSTNTLGLSTTRYGIVPAAVGVAGRDYSVNSSSVTVRADSTLFTATPDVSVVILKDPFDKEVVNVSFP
jgi:hypothetical protein